MNRMTALLASLVVALGLAVTIAPAAQAATDDCDQACVDALRAQVADLTDENTGLRSDVDWLGFKLTVRDAQVATTQAQLTATQHSLDLANGALVRMADRFTFQRELALARRATIIELRHELRDRV